MDDSGWGLPSQQIGETASVLLERSIYSLDDLRLRRAVSARISVSPASAQLEVQPPYCGGLIYTFKIICLSLYFENF